MRMGANDTIRVRPLRLGLLLVLFGVIVSLLSSGVLPLMLLALLLIALAPRG